MAAMRKSASPEMVAPISSGTTCRASGPKRSSTVKAANFRSKSGSLSKRASGDRSFGVDGTDFAQRSSCRPARKRIGIPQRHGKGVGRWRRCGTDRLQNIDRRTSASASGPSNRPPMPLRSLASRQ